MPNYKFQMSDEALKIISFLSDFGNKDWFVSAVKGEILKINRAVAIIDITHKLTPQDIRSAAFVLKAVYRNFPLGTVHLVVVDPGVGSKRLPIIIESDGYYFVGPDNGVFSYIYNKGSKVYKIKVKEILSSTFHARDIFGPVAARLSKGITPKVLGVKIKNYVRFEFPQVRKREGRIYGEVIYIDHFGNLITNIPNRTKIMEFRIMNRKIGIKGFYGEAKPGELLAIKGSCGYYEIAGNKANARKITGAKSGMRVMARPKSTQKD